MRAYSSRIGYLFGLAILLTADTVASAAAGENLISNPAFTATSGGQPQGWATHTWSGNGEFALVEDGRDGSRGVRITSTEGGDAQCVAMTVAHAQFAVNVAIMVVDERLDRRAFLATTALPLMLYRPHFGTVPVELEGDHGVLALDVAAAWTEERDALTIGAVNRNATEVTLAVDIEGADLRENGAVWKIAASDPDVYNNAEHPPVDIVSGQFEFDGRLRVPTFAIAVYRLETK